MRKLEPGLYAITPDWPETARLLAAATGVLDGGCRLLQYRNKSAAAGLRLEQALALRDLTRSRGARLIVNDDLELALRVGADGAHLGQGDGDLAAARARLGAGMLLGASCYRSLEAARRARDAGADYVAFGSFFPSPSKPHAVRAEPALLAEAGRELELPVVAIGGITPENGAILVDAGADLLAVISALFEAADPRAAARAFGRLFPAKTDPRPSILPARRPMKRPKHDSEPCTLTKGPA